MILSICSEPKVLEIMRLVNIFITIIKILIPILLIFTLMFKFAKATINNDKDNLQGVLKSAPSNVLAALIIFLVPTLVNIVVSISFPNSDYKNCISIDNVEISILYDNKMSLLLNKVQDTLDINDYFNAVNYLENIKDSDKYAQYKKRLDELKTKIDNINAAEIKEPEIDQSEIVNAAKSYIGKNVGLDCSGFVKKILKEFNYIDDEIAKTSASCDGRARGSNGMYRKYVEKGRIVWQRPSNAKNMSQSLETFPGNCVAGDLIFYSYGANDCVKHIVFYAGFENGKHMIIDSNMYDNKVRYRAIDTVHGTAYPLACARPIKVEG